MASYLWCFILLLYMCLFCPCRAVYESGSTGVVYDSVGEVVAATGPDTSQNVAYGVSKEVVASHNPVYEVIEVVSGEK